MGAFHPIWWSIWKKIRKMSGCLCEREVQKPDYSPDIVNDNEVIGYVLINPDHWEDGVLSSAAFSKSKLKAGSLSVSRIDHTSAEDIQNNIIKPYIQKNPQRAFVGILVARCSKIRALKAVYPQNSRAICVIDDGNENDPAHAHLSFSDHSKENGYWNRNDRMTIRASLKEVFQKRGVLALEDIFPV